MSNSSLFLLPSVNRIIDYFITIIKYFAIEEHVVSKTADELFHSDERFCDVVIFSQRTHCSSEVISIDVMVLEN